MSSAPPTSSPTPANTAHVGADTKRYPTYYGSPFNSPPETQLRPSRGTVAEDVARKSLVPKVVNLATRLMPAVAAEMEQNQKRHSSYSRTPKAIASGDNGSGEYKTTGLYDDEGVSTPHQVFLPQSVAAAVRDTNASTSRTTNEGALAHNNSQDSHVPIHSIAAELSPDLALLDHEADAILESIRRDAAYTPDNNNGVASGGASSRARQFQEAQDEDHFSHLSDDECDDDGMGGEMRNLDMALASLSRDLASANLDSMARELSDDDTLADLPRDDEENHLTRGIAWGSAEDAATFIKTYKLYGPGVGGQEPNVPLYFTVALVWALLILLAGRVTFGSVHELDDWEGIMDWLFGSF